MDSRNTGHAGCDQHRNDRRQTSRHDENAANEQRCENERKLLEFDNSDGLKWRNNKHKK
jgi:hypothetical protein